MRSTSWQPSGWSRGRAALLTGAGIGFGLAAASNAIIESVPVQQTGEAISANTIARTIGSSVGTAVIAALISSHADATGLPSADTFTIGFWACAAVGALAIAGALAAPSLGRRLERAHATGVADVDAIVR